MTKAEIIEAINATIAPNNVKGITAESLANILIEMVNAAGEGGGSGDGALRVIVPEFMMLGMEIVNRGELSPASWAAYKEEMKSALNLELSEYEEAVNASFVHNANIAKQILAKAKAGQGVSVVLDQTPYSSALASVMLQTQPDIATITEDIVFGGVQPAGLSLQYIKVTPEGEALMGGGEQFICKLVPTGYINDEVNGFINYPSNMLITLNFDGSLLFTKPESETEADS